MNNEIYPCLWFDGNGKEAADLYCSIFQHSKITTDTPMVVKFELEGKTIMALNGGPMFKKNPSISLFFTSDEDEEIERAWSKLSEGGKVMMALGQYPWAEKYGWLEDKFGTSWQFMRGKVEDASQRLIPSFLFVGKQYGKAQAAVERYTTLFPGSKIQDMQFYGEGETQPAGNVKFGKFNLGESIFSVMDGFGAHEFEFNEGVSLVVECDTQEEIDLYWEKLTAGGAESMCGWLKDEFGVSWQIIPKSIGKLVTDQEKGPRAMQALMKMKKIDMAALENA
jgi:predicted 3-demethylubiquinone-9 3-methyltransferase (glyoxalase superfamily)